MTIPEFYVSHLRAGLFHSLFNFSFDSYDNNILKLLNTDLVVGIILKTIRILEILTS